MATAFPHHRTPGEFGLHREARRLRIPVILAALLGYVLLLPPQLSVIIGTSSLPPYRFFLLPAAIYVLVSGVRGQFRFTWPDACILGAAGWISLALFRTTEPFEALTASVAQATDIALAYFFARSVFRTLDDFRIFLLLLAPGLLAVAAILAIEAITHTHLVQPFFSNLTGQPMSERVDIRLGLMRAPGPFPHPILAGIFLASFLPLYLLAGLRGWPRILGIASSLFAFFTVSSAALLALMVGAGLVVYNWLVERVRNLTWRLLIFIAALGITAIELATGSGTFGLLMRFASLNAVSAFNRSLIWEYGSQSVMKHPWFGIGYADWERPVWMVASVDHFWLLTAMRFGLVPPVLIVLAVVIAIVKLASKSQSSPLVDQRAERGVAIAMATFAISVVSVALWLSAQVWFFVLLGATVSLAIAGPGALYGPVTRAVERPHELRRPQQRH